MITIEEVIEIHSKLIDEFGGTKGIRDLNLLDSAINRPFQTFDQKDLYPTPIDKAAAIFESLLMNHPFIDGNKRIAYIIMRLFLMQYNLDINATQADKYDFVIRTASSEVKFNEIKDWIHKHIFQK